MSIKSEILDIARDHGFEGNAQTIKGAINALADTLAGEDAHDGKTIASAIRALAPYVGEVPSGTISITENGTDIDVASYAKADVSVSGGGSFGPLQYCTAFMGEGAPEVGDTLPDFTVCGTLVYSGSTLIVESPNSDIETVAAGLKVCVHAGSTTALAGIYAITIEIGGHSNTVATVRELTGTGLTIETIEFDGEEVPFITWTMPELQDEDECLFIGHTA